MIPAEDGPELEELVRQADGLFIFAATVVRFITSGRKKTRHQQIQLLRKLTTHGQALSEPNTPTVDTLYKEILAAAFKELDDDDFRNRLTILHILHLQKKSGRRTKLSLSLERTHQRLQHLP